MNIDKFKHQHVSILGSVPRCAAWRTRGGATPPRSPGWWCHEFHHQSCTWQWKTRRCTQPCSAASNAELARMGQQYQRDMGPIAQAYEALPAAGTGPESVRRDEQGFRDDANQVLRMVHERMQRENHDYPRIEAL